MRADGASQTESDAAAVLAHARATLGGPMTWTSPPRERSVALATIGAVWGINSQWASVRKVIERYREARRQAGADADSDGPEQLIALIDSSGGPDGFAELVANRQRTSTRNGILKADAVRQIAELLRAAGIDTPGLPDVTPERLAGLRASWTEVPGQRSGLSFDAFLLSIGRGTVKADRMVRRFVADALGAPGEQAIKPARAAELVERAAARCGVDAWLLDAAIWKYESARARTRRQA